MTATAQNGWPVLESGSPKLHRWVIPARNGTIELTLRNGAAGFLLAFLALWFSEVIEQLKGKILDDWGYAYRPIRGQSTGFSNHAAGCAEDFNSLEHPLGKVGTYRPWQYDRIHRILRGRLKGTIRWGADYNARKDEMHFEIVQSLEFCQRRARWLMRYTLRGRRLIRANPTQKPLI
jgi:hypothetical protein